MLRALVTTVSGAVVSAPDRDASARATSVVVVPPLRPTTSPGPTSSAAAAAIARFSSGRRDSLYRNGRSYDTLWATAPPRVRTSSCCSASSSRSRRTVAGETARRRAASSISTRPSAAIISRSAVHRADRGIDANVARSSRLVVRSCKILLQREHLLSKKDEDRRRLT